MVEEGGGGGRPKVRGFIALAREMPCHSAGQGEMPSQGKGHGAEGFINFVWGIKQGPRRVFFSCICRVLSRDREGFFLHNVRYWASPM